MTLMEAEFPEEKIDRSLAFYEMLGDVAKVGYKLALWGCGCHICRDLIERIEMGDLR